MQASSFTAEEGWVPPKQSPELAISSERTDDLAQKPGYEVVFGLLPSSLSEQQVQNGKPDWSTQFVGKC